MIPTQFCLERRRTGPPSNRAFGLWFGWQLRLLGANQSEGKLFFAALRAAGHRVLTAAAALFLSSRLTRGGQHGDRVVYFAGTTELDPLRQAQPEHLFEVEAGHCEAAARMLLERPRKATPETGLCTGAALWTGPIRAAPSGAGRVAGRTTQPRSRLLRNQPADPVHPKPYRPTAPNPRAGELA
jgi:hypothetical protein